MKKTNMEERERLQDIKRGEKKKSEDTLGNLPFSSSSSSLSERMAFFLFTEITSV